MNRIRFHVDAISSLGRASELASSYKFEATSPVEYLCIHMKSNGFLNVFLKSKEIIQEDIEFTSKEIMDNKADDLSDESEENEEIRKLYEEEFEKSSTIQLSDEVEIDVTAEMEDILNLAKKICKEEGDEEIVSNKHIFSAIIRECPDILAEIFKLFGIDVEGAMFELKSATNTIIYPNEIKHCFKDITVEIPFNSDCSISGREKEIDEIIRVLLKKTKRNVVLVGEAGVGKTALVEKLAYLIRSDNCPERLQKIHIVQLDVNNLIAGTMYRGQAEEKFVQLIDFLEWNKDIILFIDEVHNILGAGSCVESSLDLANSLKPILARDDVRVIGATTIGEYEKYFSRDMALKRRFEKVFIKEPTFDEVPQMIAKKIKKLEEYHNVKIDKKTVEYAITLSACFRFTGVKNPDRTLDAIDKAMADAEIKKERKLTSKNLNAAFAVKMETFNKMSKEFKKSVAYHEAGHFLVAKFSKEYSKALHIRAVSILPAEDYLGINIMENIDYVDSSSKLCFMERIAMCLAGRIAEKKFTGTLSSGARGDLDKATGMAYDLLTEFGMGKEKSFSNRVYNKEVSYGKGQDKLDKEINDIIDECYRMAESIIAKHERELKMIVTRLMKHGILTETTLNRICEKEEKKENGETIL